MTDNVRTFPKTPRWTGNPDARLWIDAIEPARLQMVQSMYYYKTLVGPVAVAKETLKLLETWK